MTSSDLLNRFGWDVIALEEVCQNWNWIFTLVRFVLVRVISWIIVFGCLKRTIHEITRTNTNKTPREIEF